MASMNLILHVAAALAFVALGYWLARLRTDLALLRRLATAKASPRLTVMVPSAFLRAYARALAIPYEEAGTAPGGPTKIDVGAWSDLLSVSVPRLLRWSDTTLTVVVKAAERQTVEHVSRQLSQALGGVQVKVEVQDGGEHAHRA